ncbi:MAG: hypothetical protein FWE05_13735 [Defluviitaleaceae bacterium]|nr:hypothetical protein [Defluviitaleaceae bacterium]
MLLIDGIIPIDKHTPRQKAVNLPGMAMFMIFLISGIICIINLPDVAGWKLNKSGMEVCPSQA